MDDALRSEMSKRFSVAVSYSDGQRIVSDGTMGRLITIQGGGCNCCLALKSIAANNCLRDGSDAHAQPLRGIPIPLRYSDGLVLAVAARYRFGGGSC